MGDVYPRLGGGHFRVLTPGRSANDTSLTLFDVAVGEQDEWRRSKMAISSVPEQVAAAGWMPARTAFLRRIGSSGTAFGERA
mmetsp:Transcript_88760/g.286843  ORF Transcript_88760/g.286843 Transcript_88760/m.286843 type:complete len:82 (+) Transcript_88760:35-280(+)